MSKNNKHLCSRRSFLKQCALLGGWALTLSPLTLLQSCFKSSQNGSLYISQELDQLYSETSLKSDIVSITKIKNGNIAKAVEEAIDLLGGMNTLTKGKKSALLKPNLVSEARHMTTKVEVTEALARLMQKEGLHVAIGEGTAATAQHNHINGEDYRTWNEETLNGLQERAFTMTGYRNLAEELNIPLINFHTGKMKTHTLDNTNVFNKFSMNESLGQYDMFCSIPMMKTHQLATVTLAMKNLFGIIPGSEYGSVRGHVHDIASKKDGTGTDAVIADLVRYRPIDLAIVDASEAMEGNGPSSGPIIKMNLIVAGTNALAVDMISALLMGFKPNQIPTFTWMYKAGMTPATLADIEVRGEKVENVWRKFKRPDVLPWMVVGKVWGHKVLSGRSSIKDLLSVQKMV